MGYIPRPMIKKSLVVPRLLAAFLLSAASLSGPAFGEPASWKEPGEPFRIFGNTYYVGSRGLSSILITSPQGHVLIDGGLEGFGPMIGGNMVSLGFALQDVKLIVNSHAHFDHAGGIAELARESDARVVMHPWSANVLRSGESPKSDPQFGALAPIPRYRAQTLRDGETLSVGPLRLTAHFTPGHTPGGTSWSWRSCEKDRCVDFVYADSLSAVAAPGFSFRANDNYPQVLADFERSFRVLESLPCDVVLAPHPDVVALWQRREAQQDQPAGPNPFVEPGACKTYVDIMRHLLEKRLAQEPLPAARPAAQPRPR